MEGKHGEPYVPKTPSLRRRRKSQGEFLAEAEVGRIIDEINGVLHHAELPGL
jgi:hypothetical protein